MPDTYFGLLEMACQVTVLYEVVAIHKDRGTVEFLKVTESRCLDCDDGGLSVWCNGAVCARVARVAFTKSWEREK